MVAVVAAQQHNGSEACTNRSELLEGLRSEDVTVFETPSFTSNKCGGEWSQFGTCCEEKSLESYVKRDTAKLTTFHDMMVKELLYSKNIVADMKSSLERLPLKRLLIQKVPRQQKQLKKKTNFSSLVKKVKKSLLSVKSSKINPIFTVSGRSSNPDSNKSAPNSEDPDIGKKIKISFKNVKKYLSKSLSKSRSSPINSDNAPQTAKEPKFTETDLKQQLPGFIEELAKMSAVFSKAAADLPAAFKSCTLKNLALRSSAVCSICSGRSRVFLKDQKMLVSMDTCGVFVDTCFDAWTMLIQIMNGIKKAQLIFDKIRQIRPDLMFPYKKEFITAVHTWIKESNLELTKNCKGSPSGCSEQIKYFICQSLMNVEQATFEEASLELFVEGRSTITQKEKEEFDRMRTKFVLKTNQRGQQRRPVRKMVRKTVKRFFKATKKIAKFAIKAIKNPIKAIKSLRKAVKAKIIQKIFNFRRRRAKNSGQLRMKLKKKTRSPRTHTSKRPERRSRQRRNKRRKYAFADLDFQK